MDYDRLQPPLEGPWKWAAELPLELFLKVADYRYIERGLNYFLNGSVESLTYDREQDAFRARVVGTREYHVTLREGGNGLLHTCDCPVHSSVSGCKHVAATVAMVYYLTQNRWFTKHPPAPLLVAPSAEALLASVDDSSWMQARAASPVAFPDEESDAAKMLPACLGVRFASDGSVSYFEHGLDRLEFTNVNAKIAFFDKLQRVKEGMEEFTAWADFPLRLLGKVRELGLDVAVETPEGECIRLNGEREKTAAPWKVNLDSQAGEVRLIRSAQAPLPEGAIRLRDHNFVFRNGVLGLVVAAPHNELTDLAESSNLMFQSVQGYRRGVVFGQVGAQTMDTFNRGSLYLLGNELRPCFQDTQLMHDGEAVDSAALENRTPVKACLSLNVGRFAAQVEAQVTLMAEGHEMPVEPLVASLKNALFGRDIDERLVTAKGRLQALIDGANRLLLAQTKPERRLAMQQTKRNKAFKSAGHQRSAKQWLMQFASDWIATDNHWHLFASADGWLAVQSPRTVLAQLLLSLIPIKEQQDIYHLEADWMVPRVDLPTFLSRAALVCSACGAELRYNNQEIQHAQLEISVEAAEGEEIDWFELRAEIRCGQFTIPQMEWERLIRGELLLEKEGRLTIPELDQADAVARLRELLSPAGQKEKRTSAIDEAVLSVPRLQTLEWLELRRMGVRVRLPDEAEQIFERLRNFESIPRVPLPRWLKASLRDYQRTGFDWLAWLFENRFGACLADDMGLGKTIQAITFLAWVKQRTRSFQSLVLMPPSLIFNWRREIERFAPALTVSEHIGGKRALADALKADVILTTYDLVHRDINELKEVSFDVVVMDEVQALKNIAAVRTKAASRLKRRFTLCLTGTPLENHVGEYFSIMHLALPGIFGAYSEFRKRLKAGDDSLLRRARPFVLRRTKGQILTELPPKVEAEVYLDMTEEQKEIYTRVVGEVRTEVLAAYHGKPHAQAGIVALAALMRLRQVCVSPELLGKTLNESAPKIAYLADKMHELQDEGYAGLFFSQFTRTLDLVEKMAAKEGLRVLRLDGSTPTVKRQQLVETFQEAPETHLFLISLRAGGVGLNLTRAQYVFHIDPWWNPAVEQQASDRAHRIGQQSTVFVQRLVMRHSVEEKIMQLKRRKQALFEAIVEDAGADSARGSLINKDDFEYLLS